MRPKQASPLLPHMLSRIFEELTLNPGHTAWRAAVLLSFRALLLKSQVTASEATLRRSDFTFFDWGMIVKVRRCKTIQFNERILEIPVSKCSNHTLCMVDWTRRHFLEIPVGGFSYSLPRGFFPDALLYLSDDSKNIF